MSGPLTNQINVNVNDDMNRMLGEIYSKHKISRNDLARALLDAACGFYKEHGWFSLPVRIEPEAFQAKYLERNKRAKKRSSE